MQSFVCVFRSSFDLTVLNLNLFAEDQHAMPCIELIHSFVITNKNFCSPDLFLSIMIIVDDIETCINDVKKINVSIQQSNITIIYLLSSDLNLQNC